MHSKQRMGNAMLPLLHQANIYKKKIQEGQARQRLLSQDQIGRLEALGSEGSRKINSSFRQRLAEISASKQAMGTVFLLERNQSNEHYCLDN